MRLPCPLLLLPVLTASQPPSGADLPMWSIAPAQIPSAIATDNAQIALGPCSYVPECSVMEEVVLQSASTPDSVAFIPDLGAFLLSGSVLRGIASNRIERLIDQQMLDGIEDGSLSPRLPQWRPRLLAMLVTGGSLDFDVTFGLLLGTCPGSEGDERMAALHRWAEEQNPRYAADVYRAETRHWLRAGECERAVDAANRMEMARPDYRVRACRLRAVAYASSVRLEQARESLAAALRENPPPEEWAELLYLGAWIDLQDGDEEKARLDLEKILSRAPTSPVANRARRILSTLQQEVDE